MRGCWYFLAEEAYLCAACISPAGSWYQPAEGQSEAEKPLRIKRKLLSVTLWGEDIHVKTC